MLFNSIDFLLFFPLVVLVYYILPKKIRFYWLLVASYYFYMSWNAKYALLLVASTVVTYLSGIFIQKANDTISDAKKQIRVKKAIVAISCAFSLGMLFFFKYFNFASYLATRILEHINISFKLPVFDIVLPIGISFYTFQALSYTMDVYRGDTPAEKNFFKYALFVSFFPQLIAGPIEKSKDLLKQLDEPKQFDFESARDGFFQMLWGYFLKLVLADRIAIFVNTIYNDYTTFPGAYLIVASILFAVQIYCDFSGYSTISKGAAQILGIKLMSNFEEPYLATSVAAFWRRWHISLTSWFREYLYIPLGGNRKGKLRKYLNIVIVFLVSGLWHGASLSFIVWGLLNGLYQVVGSILSPVRNKVVQLLQLNRESFGHKLLQGCITFLLVDFSWIFFKANSIRDAIAIIKSAFSVHNPWILFDGSLYACGLDEKNFRFMLLAIAILIFVDLFNSKGIIIRKVVYKQDYWFRWIFIALAIAFLFTFGIWGPNYNESNFIYFQF